MASATFDTLKFANTLKSAGVPDKQAEAQAAAFAEVIQINFKELATKDDLTILRTELKRDIADLRTELKHDTDEVKSELKREMNDLRGELRLLKWMTGAGLSMGVAILVRLFLFRGPIG